MTGGQLNNRPVDIINANNGRLPPPYPGQDGVYTAAVFTRAEDVPTMFVVGDNTVTRAPDGAVYTNRELSEDTTYGIFDYIRLQSDSGAAVRITISDTNNCIILPYKLLVGYNHCFRKMVH